MNLEQQVTEIVSSVLTDPQYFITEVRAKEGGAKTKIAIYLDGDEGIDIGVCARVNKQVGRQIEELALLNNPYTLEVSSPGLDQPLKLPRQYHRNIGKKIKVTTEQEQFEGVLQEVVVDHIIIEQMAGKKARTLHQVPFKEIVKTHVLVSF